MMNLTKGETVVSIARLATADLKQDDLTVPLEIEIVDNGNGHEGDLVEEDFEEDDLEEDGPDEILE